jgi:ABC transport system ATP-binding/permease protein
MKMTIPNTKVKDGNRTFMSNAPENDGQTASGSRGVLLQAKDLTIRTRAGKSLLSNLSFHIEPGELVALTGLSRSGKSTLLQCLAGLQKPESGEILMDGVSLYPNLKAFRSSIGFVPAEFTLPQNLTVAEILEEGARLRLPRRTSTQDCKQRVSSLLETVSLTHVSNSQARVLSRVERRRLNIAVELIAYPGLLLLDESAEHLTPFEEVQITILLRELSRLGITIIQADQRSRSAGLSDWVIFLAPGGLLAWSGPPDEAFIYLRSFVPGGIVKDLFGLREALEVLANPQLQEGIEWAKRFKANPAYEKYVDDPLDNRFPDLMLQTHPLLRLRLRNASKEKLPPSTIPRASTLQKLILLTSRNFRLVWRDKSVLFMLAIPPLVALVDIVLSSATVLAPDRAPIVTGMLVFLALLTAALLVQNEIFKEKKVYRRENRTSSLALPYILSKVWLIGTLAIYQGLVWAIIHFMATKTAGGLQALLAYAITFFLLSVIGGLLGLMASVLSRTAIVITCWILLFTVPQLLLSGSVIPTKNLAPFFILLSQLNPSYYAFETLLTLSGIKGGLNSVSFSWTILGIMSLCLIVLLVSIQQRAGSLKV